jgi:hypothetical protein
MGRNTRLTDELEKCSRIKKSFVAKRKADNATKYSWKNDVSAPSQLAAEKKYQNNDLGGNGVFDFRLPRCRCHSFYQCQTVKLEVDFKLTGKQLIVQCN